jgi:hypothetical protein
LLAIAAVACGEANPSPVIPGGATGTRSVLLIGDSLMLQAAPYVQTTLAWYGMNTTVADTSVGGTGLLDTGIRERIAASLDAAPARSVVVFQYWGNCLFVAPAGCGPYTYGSTEFFQAWEAMMRTLISDARARSHTVIWVNNPPSSDANQAGVPDLLNTMYTRVCRQLGVQLADWLTALTDVDGKYQQYLLYAKLFEEPTWHQVRDADGTHLAVDGSQRAALWLAAAVRNVWEQSGPTTTTTTTTTTTSTTTTTTTAPPTTTTTRPKHRRPR